MGVVLLDTSVASLYLPHKKPTTQRTFYDPLFQGHRLALSFQSVAELWKLAEKNQWGDRRRQGLEGFLRRFLVIPFDIELTRVWARVSVEAERLGRRLQADDAWIAATAVHRSLPLYTEDDDFIGLSLKGLQIISSRSP